ncbi:MAG: DUF4340 domain-containing protein [Isosphaeraceae bacterium]|nr:DUF4340 domain-containing protein [Isosphaeraceae bacterium]
MNRETRKTAIFVGVALLLTGAAFVTIPDRTGLNTAFDDQGKKFFPEASDPNACTSLEVIDYDPATASALPFKVEFKNGKWTIPSHHDYPADARERLSKTAGAVFDLAKDIVRSDRVEDHEKFGVVDPLDTKAASLKGQGKRITLKDASDKVLADFIIGSEVKDRPGYRYVRDPRYNRTYGVKVGADLSSKFGDWIEKNLLKVDATKIRRIVWDPTKVDPERGVLIRGDRVVLERKDASSPWNVPGLVIPPGRELDTTKINAMISALSDLQIVGVRTKPAGLTRDLQVGGESGIKLTQSAVVSLQNKGFYPTKDGSIYSNQGDMKIETDDGAVYTIRFGEVSFATGETLTSGEGEDESAEAKAKAAGKTEPAAKPAGTEENRYVMVTVGFQPDLVPAPPEPIGPPTTLPSDVFLRKPGTPEYEAQQK